MGRLIKFEDFKMEDDMPKQVLGATSGNPSGCLPQSVLPEMSGPVDDDEEIEAEETEELEETKTKPTTKAQDYVSEKIAKLKEEGYPDDQATAIAFSMAKKRGFDVAVDEENAPHEEAKKPHPTINKVNEKKPNPHKYLKGRNELDENVEDKEDRALDAPYITNGVKMYSEDLMEEDPEVAMELRQVARSMKAQYPNNRDIGLYDAYEIADEQGIEDEKVLQKVKDELKYIWAQV